MALNKNDSISIVVSVDDKGTPVIKGVSSHIKGLESTTKRSSANMQSSFGNLWKSIAAGAVAFMALNKSVGSAIEYQKEFANVMTLYDTAAVGVENLQSRVLDLTGELGGATEMAKGMYMSISAGQEAGTEALNFTANSAAFAKANIVELGSAVDITSTIFNVFGTNVEHISDTLTTVIRMGKTTGSELSMQFGNVAATAKAVGISFEELSAATIALTAGGVKTRQAITSMKAVIANVATPSNQATAAAKKLGVQFSLAGLQAKGFAGFLTEMATKAKGNVQAQKDLFGSVEAFNAIAVLTSERGLAKFNQGLIEIQNSAGATGIAMEKQQKTFAATMETTKNQIEATFIRALLPSLEKAAEWLRANKEQIMSFASSAATGLADVSRAVGGVVMTVLQYRDAIFLAGKAWLLYFSLSKIIPVMTAIGAGFKLMSTSSLVAIGSIKQLSLNYRYLQMAGVSAGEAMEATMASTTATFTGFGGAAVKAFVMARVAGAGAFASIAAGAKAAWAAMSLLTKAFIVFAAAWAIYKIIDMTGWFKASDALSANSVELTKNAALVKSHGNVHRNVNANMVTSINKVAAANKIAADSFSNQAVAIASNTTAYKSLTVEQKKYIDNELAARALRNANTADSLRAYAAESKLDSGRSQRETARAIASSVVAFESLKAAAKDSAEWLAKMPEEYKTYTAEVQRLIDKRNEAEAIGLVQMVEHYDKQIQAGLRLQDVQRERHRENVRMLRSVENMIGADEKWAAGVAVVSEKVRKATEHYKKRREEIKANSEDTKLFIMHLQFLTKDAMPSEIVAIQGMIDWLRKGKEETKSASSATDEYKKAMESFASSIGLINARNIVEVSEKTKILTDTFRENQAIIASSPVLYQKFTESAREMAQTYIDSSKKVPPALQNMLDSMDNMAIKAKIINEDMAKSMGVLTEKGAIEQEKELNELLKVYDLFGQQVLDKIGGGQRLMAEQAEAYSQGIQKWIETLRSYIAGASPEMQAEIKKEIELLEKKQKAVFINTKAYEQMLKSIGVFTKDGLKKNNDEAEKWLEIYKANRGEIEQNHGSMQKYIDVVKALAENVSPKLRAALLATKDAMQEKILATKISRDELDKYADAMGILTKDGLFKQRFEIKKHIEIWDVYSDQILHNRDAAEQWRETLKKSTEHAMPEQHKKILEIIDALDEYIAKLDTTKNMLSAFSSLGNIFEGLGIGGSELNQIIQGVTGSIGNLAEAASKFKGFKSGSFAGIMEGAAALGPIVSAAVEAQNQLAPLYDKLFGGEADTDMKKWGQKLFGLPGRLFAEIASETSKMSKGLRATIGTAYFGVPGLLAALFGFGGDGVGEAIEREAQPWMNISEELEEKIRSLEKQTGSTHAAMSLLLPEMLQQTAFTMENFGDIAGRVKELFIDFEEGTISLNELQDTMGQSWTKLVAEARRLGTEGSREMVEIIREMGVRDIEVPEIAAYIQEELQTGIGAFNSYVDHIGDAVNLDRVIEYFHSFWNSLIASGKSPAEAMGLMGSSLEKIIQKTNEQKKALEEQAKKASGEELESLRAQIAGIDESLHDLYDTQRYKDFIEQNRYTFEAMAAEMAILNAMGNTGAADFADTLRRSQQSVGDYYKQFYEQQIKAKETPETAQKRALESIAPMLARQLYYAKEYGIELDDNTKRLMEQAAQHGINIEGFITEQEQQKQFQDEQKKIWLGIADIFADAFGVKLPGYLQDFRDEMDSFANEMPVIDVPFQFNNVGDPITVPGGETGTGTGAQEPPLDVPGFASGTGGVKMVPPGYNNDNYLVGLSSNETFEVRTPSQQSTGNNAGGSVVEQHQHFHTVNISSVVLPGVTNENSADQLLIDLRKYIVREEIRSIR